MTLFPTFSINQQNEKYTTNGKTTSLKEEREQKLKERVTYYAGLPGQLKDEGAMYEEDILTDTEEQETDQGDSEDSSDVFIDPSAEGDFGRLQRDF